MRASQFGTGPSAQVRRTGRICCCLCTVLNLVLYVIYLTVFSDYVEQAKLRMAHPPPNYLHEHYEGPVPPPGSPIGGGSGPTTKNKVQHSQERIKSMYDTFQAQHGSKMGNGSTSRGGHNKIDIATSGGKAFPFLDLVAHLFVASRAESGAARAKRHKHNDHSHGNAAVLVPPGMLLNFTMNATIPLRYEFRDERGGESDVMHNAQVGEKLATVEQRKYFDQNALANVLTEVWELQKKYSKKKFDVLREDGQLYEAMFVNLVSQQATMLFKGKNVLVFGSLSFPAVEVTLLVVGEAKGVTTVEHRPFLTSDRRITCEREADFWKEGAPQNMPGQYEVIVSFGAVQHDGLGRYGDRLDPFGDVAMMGEMWSLLRPGGYLVLTLPVANDCLAFNMYRTYGRRRLPLLLLGWKVIDTVGFSESRFEDNHCTQKHQPTIILQKMNGLIKTEEVVAGETQALMAAMLELEKVPGLFGQYPLYSLS